MSNFTDFGETWVCNFIRGTADALPANFDVGLLTGVSDNGFTEVSWNSYARQPVARSLAAWAGTQGNGTTAVSTGTSHTTSNNETISFGTADGEGIVSAIGLFVGNDLFAYSNINAPINVVSGDNVKLDPSALVFTLGATGGCTDWLSNKLIDHIWRGKNYPYPVSMFLGLYSTTPGNNTRGTEISGNGYARQPINNSAWEDPDGGTIATNADITFPVPTGNWGTIRGCAFLDALTNGNILWWANVTSPKTIVNGGAAPRFDAGALTIQVL